MKDCRIFFRPCVCINRTFTGLRVLAKWAIAAATAVSEAEEALDEASEEGVAQESLCVVIFVFIPPRPPLNIINIIPGYIEIAISKLFVGRGDYAFIWFLMPTQTVG